MTEGVFAKDGTFHAVAWPSPEVLEQEFRRLLLAALVGAERLTEEFAANLLSWAHSGFSAYAASRVDALDLDGLEPCPPVGRRSRTTSARAGAARERRTARYVTRPALAAGAVSIRDDGRVEVATPPDPATGSASVTMDELDFVHAVVTQIPDARRHLVRYYGACSHRRRAAVREKNGVAGQLAAAGPADATVAATEPVAAAPEPPVRPAVPGSADAARRSARARLLKKVFEVDPLRCPTRGGEMKVIAWITDRAVIDRILAHRERQGLASPFDARGPPTVG